MLVPPSLQRHLSDELLCTILSILSEMPESITNPDILCDIIMDLEPGEMLERVLNCLLQIVKHSDLVPDCASRIFTVMKRIEDMPSTVQYWYILQLECEIVISLAERVYVIASPLSIKLRGACSYDDQLVKTSLSSLLLSIPDTVEGVLSFLFSIVSILILY